VAELHHLGAPQIVRRAVQPGGPDYKQFAKDLIASRFAYVDQHLAQHGPFLMGSQFTVADAYLFTVANWTHFLKIDLGQWPHLKAYVERVAARPKVHEALKEERLVR
jgi:glutathione S-transferase